MKYTLIKKSILTRIALVTLMTATYFTSYASNNICADILNDAASPFIAQEIDSIKNFFDKNNNTSYNTHMIHMGNIDREFAHKLVMYEELMTASEYASPLPKQVLRFGHWLKTLFNPIFNILKRYNGKKSDQALALSNELLKAFDAEKMFKEISAQLAMIFEEAKAENNMPLMKAIHELMVLIKNKKNEMAKIAPNALFTGLVTRMKH